MIHDVARIGHAELLTPKPEESLGFFADVLGMEEEAREGQSVYLRGWGDYLRYSLKLTESETSGLGHIALRAWSPEALERRVAAIEETGLGRGWIDGDVGHGPAYRFEDPDGHAFELYYEAERYVAPEHLRPSLAKPAAALHRPRRLREAARPRERPRRRRPRRAASSARSVLGYRLYERIELDDGTETGAWMSLSIAAHELIYVADHAGARGRLHHLAFWVDTREECLRAADIFVDAGVDDRGGAVQARRRPGLLPLRLRAGRQPDRGHDRRLLRLRPRPRADHWTEAERARGQFWGVQTVESFHTYGTPRAYDGSLRGDAVPPRAGGGGRAAGARQADGDVLAEARP